MLAYWDAGCRNVVANGAFGRWTGLSPREVRGRHKREVIGDTLYDQALPHIDGVLGGTPRVFERVYTDSGGTVHRAHVVYSPDIVGGQVVGFFSVAIDVTEHDLPAPPSCGWCIEEVDGVLIQGLTRQELRVLEFLPTYLSTADIAARLHVSVNTLKTHLKVIYRKLGATSRSEAVARGVAAHLLPGDVL
jgi:PAS domain S-box-containing protein